jgi:uncharacterized membrane protein
MQPGDDMHEILLCAGVFAASAVEMVEALTIVLAVGVTRGWRSATWGILAALACLALICVTLGPALTEMPIDLLRVAIGTLLLIFGMQWLRKAILRAAHLQARHDEVAVFQAEVALLESEDDRASNDWYAFTVAFKGVFLEGLEVAFIVVTVGGTQGNVGLAALSAAAALVLVLVVGVVAYAPLSRVPENNMKFAVGVMLTSFGMFWAAEGAGAAWPGGDAAIFGLIVFVAMTASGMVVFGRSGMLPSRTSGSA